MTDFLKIAKSIAVHFAHICAYGVETVNVFNSCIEFMYLFYLNCVDYFLIHVFIIFEMYLFNSCIYYF